VTELWKNDILTQPALFWNAIVEKDLVILMYRTFWWRL